VDSPSEPERLPQQRAKRKRTSLEREERRPGPLDPIASSTRGGSILVLIPVFNDWASLAQLFPRLDAALAAEGLAVDVLVVDDGSTAEPEEDLAQTSFRALRRIDVLRLRRNLGHQRAIAVGLAYVEDCLPSQAVVVMDGDGEDDPADVPRLLGRLEEVGRGRIIFAERTRRSESLVFRVFYAVYQLLHYVLTGQKVRVGNFSAIPRRRLSSLVVVTELWNHYAAAVFRSRQPHCLIPTQRSERLRGRSKMNFVSLVTHGLSAISVYSDVVGVRLLVMSAVLAILTLGGILATLIVRLTTDLAIPGWATYTIGLLLILLVQVVMAAFVFSFMVLGARHGSPFLPRRDYSFFIGAVRTLHGPEQSVTPLPIPQLAGEALSIPPV
jgi:glycosyltransferase involved in cell wall biosynthesis